MASSIPLLETIEIILHSNGVAEIAFNRPKKFNAFNDQIRRDWLAAYQWAASCDAVKVVVQTGRGKYYSSGKEISDKEESDEEFKAQRALTKAVVDTFINFPKVVIAAINGPAIGFAVTTLALFDVVYSVPEATFNTPFMKWAFCAEGCSSYLFPKIMGASKANEMLLMGRTFSAKELTECGLVSRILPSENFHEQVLNIANETAKFSSEALAVTKKLVRDVDRQTLLDVNETEMKELSIRLKSPDSIAIVKSFAEAAKKKRAAKLAKQQNSKL